MKKLLITAVSILCLTVVFFFNRDYIASAYARLAVFSQDMKSSFTDKKQLAYENNRLAIEYEKERARASDYHYIRAENQKLRELLALREKTEYPSVGAEVFAYGENSDYEYFLADRGSLDGVEVGCCVISQGGFAGIVSECGEDWCGIKTLYSKDISLSVTCSGNGKTYLLSDLKLSFVSRGDGVEKWDLLSTSGLSGNIPKGIKIGRAEAVVHDGGVECEVEVSPMVDYKNMDYILILTR